MTLQHWKHLRSFQPKFDILIFWFCAMNIFFSICNCSIAMHVFFILLPIILLRWNTFFSGLNWSKEICSCFPWISKEVKLLKLMLHHLLLSKYVFLLQVWYSYAASVFNILLLTLALEQVAGNDKDSILISFASKSSNAVQVTSKLHVIELGAQPGEYIFHNSFLVYIENLCRIQ